MTISDTIGSWERFKERTSAPVEAFSALGEKKICQTNQQTNKLNLARGGNL